jgi:hypothetical protein
MVKHQTSRKASSATARRVVATRKPATAKRKTPRAARSAQTGTIGRAATKVVKSGTRMIAAGAKAAKVTLEGALHSTARATSSALHSAAIRVQKIAAK